MRRRGLRLSVPTALLLSMLLCASGCDDEDTSSPGTAGTTVPPGTPLTGRERLAWDQAASSLEAVTSYTFSAFVDGTAAGTLAAQCSTASANTFTCVAPLPALSAGSHVLTIQTTDRSGSSSSPSTGLSILVQAAAAATSFVSRMTNAATNAALSLASVCVGGDSGRQCYELKRIASQLASPSRPLELPDGRIVIMDDGRLLEAQSGSVRPLAIDGRLGTRVVDVAVAPDSRTSGEVYVVEATANGRVRSADVVRFRDINGVLGQRAVIVPGIALPAEGDPVLFVDDQIVVAVPRAADGAISPGTLLRYDRAGRSAGYRVGTPALAWGTGRPTALLKFGDSVAATGFAPDRLVFGVLAPGATSLAPVDVANRLADSGGVRAVARTGNLLLLAAGDGSLHSTSVQPSGDLGPLQRLDTRGTMITGLVTTRDGGLVATTLAPGDQNISRGVVYQLSPVPNPDAR